MKEPFTPQKLVRNFLIFFLLLILILTPRLIAGLQDLSSARRFDTARNYAAAAHAYAMAAERLPWQPTLWEKAGMDAQLGSDSAGAVTFLNQAATRNAVSQQGWISLGMAYRSLGDLPSAVKAWQRALPLAKAYRYLAEDQRKLGQFSAAINNWRASLVREPGNAQARYQLGLLEMATYPKDALPDLLRAAQLDSSMDASVQNLRSVLNKAFLSDDSAYQFLISGRALGVLGEWDLATLAFHNAIATRPDYADAWAWLAEAEQQQGQDSRKEIQRALVLNPNSAMVQSLYGLYLQRQKRPAEALDAFKKAATLEPDDPGWQMALGRAYEQTDDLVAALEHYQRAVELAPEDASVWQALAEFSLRDNVDLTGTGLPAARRLVELASDDWQSLDIAGQIILETGDSLGAEVLLKKSIQLSPGQAAPILHLGLLYLQSTDSSRAYPYLILARDLDPNGPYGWQANRLLQQYFP